MAGVYPDKPIGPAQEFVIIMAAAQAEQDAREDED